MPLLIPAIAFITFTVLLLLGHVGEASYCFLAAASALVGLVLHGFGRLQELDLRSLRLVLRDIEQTKKELFVREEKLKQIAVPLAQIIALSGASEGRLGSKESWAVKREWYRRKIETLVTALELSPTDAVETLKYSEKYDEFDRVIGDRDSLLTSDPDYAQVKANLELLAAELEAMMQADIKSEA